MKCLIVDNKTNYTKELVDFLKEFGIKDIDIYFFNDLDSIKEDNYDLIILSGGSVDISGNKDIHKEEKLILNSKIPIFGICAGFQIICYVFQSKIERLKTLEQGIKNITYTHGNKKNLRVYENHKFCVRDVPNGFEIISSSSSGIEIIKSKERIIWATQFHPEIDFENNDGWILFEEFLKEIKKCNHTQNTTDFNEEKTF